MTNKIRYWLAVALLVLIVNAGYLAAFASATVFYMGNVLFHVALGFAITLGGLWLLRKSPDMAKGAPTAVGFFLVSFVAGAYLTWKGSLIEFRWILLAHVVTGILAVAAMIPWVWKKAAEDGGAWIQFRKGFQYAAIFLVALPLVAIGYRKAYPDPNDRIVNPLTVPTEMAEEGGGPKSPFFPSSAKTNVGGIIPSNFFMDSETCGECHKEVYKQWNSSNHHFASFNNQFYRKAIEYMQDTQGSPQPSKWCAGCHDHAVFFNGRFEKPIKGQIDTPEAHAGLACTSCHAITHVEGSMGNGGFTMEYPALHQLMTTKNKYVKTMIDFMTFLDPEPHRRTFLKPFMTKNASEFCSACHKVHLDVPVNNYRWFRGFNDYDNWQASGFGEGARSFYYPPKGQTCADCHMPMTPSTEPGNRNGQIHSHRFAAANTAVPFVNHDQAQMDAAKKLLTSGFITLDIFAAAPVDGKEGKVVRRAATGPQLMSGGAVGEESDQTGDTFIREVGKVAAPLNKANLKLTPGSTTRVDMVVRTRKIGHFFPGGTIDAFDIWLELTATDSTGKNIFWSGELEKDGMVEPGAHFYRAFQLDAAGNMINKRNAWQARTVLYARQIQPGAADTVHYLIHIPKDAKGPITLHGKLNYRKFSQYYAQFAFAGKPKPGQDPSLLDKNHNSMEYTFNKEDVPANVSAELKGEIPQLPITVLAEADAKFDITNNPAETQWNQIATKADRERWNDWGIGMLLQGDLKGAEFAFNKVTVAEPGYADGWLNVARALIQEGETEAAKPFIAKSLEMNPALGRTYYFRSQIEKADGDYDAALKSLAITVEKYPRDRVVLNQVGRILFLKRQYKESIAALQKVGLVDPEDLQMHYTAMLAYRGMGDTEHAAREEKLFRRFKVEESSQSITGIRRLVSPEDNNERQNIHDHESVALNTSAPVPQLNAMTKKKLVAQKQEKPKKTLQVGGFE